MTKKKDPRRTVKSTHRDLPPGVSPEFMKMVRRLMKQHDDVLRELAKL